MKKLTILLFLCALATGVYAWTGFPGLAARSRTVSGSGRPAHKTLPAIPFEALHASRSVQVRLVPGGDSIRIEADHNLIDYVTVEMKGNTLHVSLAPDIQPRRPRILVVVPTAGRIASLKATSSASIVSETELKGECVELVATSSGELAAAVTADRCELRATSSADLQAGVHAPECTVHASSSADITAVVVAENCDVKAASSAKVTLQGEARTCNAQCSSSAVFEAGQFAVASYRIAASSSAYAAIYCTNLLQAKASSSGTIGYRGDCQAETHASSGGRIAKK